MRATPLAGIVGLLASASAMSLWVADEILHQSIPDSLAILLKVVVIASPLFFLSDLSAVLCKRPKVAIALGVALVAATLCAMALYLPWRETFAARQSNYAYRWYSFGNENRFHFPYFEEWRWQWTHGVPHMIEASLVIAYYGLIISVCALRRLGRAGGAGLALAGYVLLFFVPILTGLFVFDYDSFFRGIAFDSISIDLFPLFFWYPSEYSIFLYSFMFIFFAVSTTFLIVLPRTRPDTTEESNEPTSKPVSRGGAMGAARVGPSAGSRGRRFGEDDIL